MDTAVTTKHGDQLSEWKPILEALTGVLYFILSEDNLEAEQDGGDMVPLDGWTEHGIYQHVISQDGGNERPARFRTGGQAVWDVFEEVKRLLLEGLFDEAIRVCDTVMARKDLELGWALSFVRAGLCLKTESLDLAGCQEYLQQGMGYVDEGDRLRAQSVRFVVASMLASRGNEVHEIKEYLYHQLVLWAETSPETELFSAPFYVMMYSDRGDDERSYEILKTAARQRMPHIALFVLRLWPRLLVRLGKWNEQADVRRVVKWFTKSFPEIAIRELGRFYVEDGWSNWQGSFFREARFFSDLAGLLLPKDCPEAADQAFLASWVACSIEIVRLAQDERLEKKTRVRAGAWFVADCEAIERDRSTAEGMPGTRVGIGDDAKVALSENEKLEAIIERQFTSMLEDEAYQGPLNSDDVRTIRSHYPHLYAAYRERLLAV